MPYASDLSATNFSSGVFLRFSLCASSYLINPAALSSPFSVLSYFESSPSTLIYTVQYFKSVVTIASVTVVIRSTLGSLTSRIIAESSFATSELIRMLLLLFFLISFTSWHFYHTIGLYLIKLLKVIELFKYKSALISCGNLFNIILKSLKRC